MDKADKAGKNALCNIIVAEETKAVDRKLNTLKDNYNSQLNQVTIPTNEFADPKECHLWRTINAPKEIEEHLINRNRKHFRQAQGSFPTIPPISEHIDWEASTLESELILEGNYDNSDLTAAGKRLIEQMQATTPLDSISLPH